MTLPLERARALRLAGELLRRMQACEEVPQALRADAARVLRHYPDGVELRLWAHSEWQRGGPMIWLAPEAPAEPIGHTIGRTRRARS